jgi:hypothetical protein
MDRRTSLAKPSTQEGRRLLLKGLFIGGGLVAANQVNVAEILAQCAGPNVICTEPDGVQRRAYADIYRIVRNGGNDYAISDAAVKVFVLAPIGTSDHPELDRQNPNIGPDGQPNAFKNLKDGTWREVDRVATFKAAQPGDPRFNGKLIDADTGLDYLEVKRGAQDIKDRAIGRLRGSNNCEASANNCVLNCVETMVIERQRSGSDLTPFVNSQGQKERFQYAVWSWAYDKMPDHKYLVSYTDVSDAQIRTLIATNQAALIAGPSPLEVSVNHQLEVVK